MNPISVHVLNTTPERKAVSHWLGRSISFFAGLVLLFAIALALSGCLGNGGASAVYPGYLGAQRGYYPPPPPRAPLTTRCTRLGIDGEQLLCQSY